MDRYSLEVIRPTSEEISALKKGMYTRFDFPEIFRTRLNQKASFFVEKHATFLEKAILEQHALLTELTNLPWKPYNINYLTKYKLGVFIGAGEGLDNVHEAYFLGKEIRDSFAKIEIRYITSGAIGVTEGKAETLGVPGINAQVMSKLLEEYGVPKGEIITEDKSLHTGMQATEMKKIIKQEKFDAVICVVDYWHGARLSMTVIGKNPNTKWYSHYVEIDKDNIGSALFDWGQKVFQTPLLIAECARIHKYVDNRLGPPGLNQLCSYYAKFHPRKLKGFIKAKKLSRLKFLWDETHEEILGKFEKFKKYR